MKTILITGGTGLVGSALIKKLKAKSYNVRLLSRAVDHHNTNLYTWDVSKMKIDENSFHEVDYVIHLAGESIVNKRWTANQKKKIIDSRVNSSKLIVNTIKKMKIKPKVIISASGVGFYGTSNSNVNFTENHPSNQDDFLSYTCQLWENEINEATKLGIRTVNVRTGLVLSNKGGAFPKMTTPIKLGAGAILGSGKQYMPWIHIDDLCAVYIEAIENKLLSGPINAAAPQDISNRDFTIAVAEHLNKTLWLPKVPSFLLTMIFGDMASLFLKGNKVQPNKVLSIKFKFKFPTLNQALFDLLG